MAREMALRRVSLAAGGDARAGGGLRGGGGGLAACAAMRAVQYREVASSMNGARAGLRCWEPWLPRCAWLPDCGRFCAIGSGGRLRVFDIAGESADYYPASGRKRRTCSSYCSMRPVRMS